MLGDKKCYVHCPQNEKFEITMFFNVNTPLALLVIQRKDFFLLSFTYVGTQFALFLKEHCYCSAR